MHRSIGGTSAAQTAVPTVLANQFAPMPATAVAARAATLAAVAAAVSASNWDAAHAFRVRLACTGKTFCLYTAQAIVSLVTVSVASSDRIHAWYAIIVKSSMEGITSLKACCSDPLNMSSCCAVELKILAATVKLCALV